MLKQLSLVIFASSIFFISCSKEGTGGRAAVNGTVKHGEKIIPGALVYIKYGATDLPGTTESDYDAVTTASGDGAFEFTNLKKGDYFLYAKGVDQQAAVNVEGGTSVKLKRTENKTTDISVN